MDLYINNRRVVKSCDGWITVCDGRYSDPKPTTIDEVVQALMRRMDIVDRRDADIINEMNRATINKERAVRCEFCGSVCSLGIDGINLMQTAMGKRISAPVVMCECCWEHDEDMLEKFDPYLSEEHAHAEMASVFKAIAIHYWNKEEPEFNGVQIDNAVQMLFDSQFGEKDMGPWIRNPNVDGDRRWLHRIEVR